LLAILGERACAADPLLAVRLAGRARGLPVLGGRLGLVAAPGRVRGGERVAGTGTLLYSPGTAGVARTGPVSRLLATQLALPRRLLALRLAEAQLLYREHRAPAPPAPELVTVVLDVSPPVFGPAELVLRLAAHLVVAAGWEFGQVPGLVTLADPGRVVAVAGPGELVGLWTARTLAEPGPALGVALATAAGAGRVVVVLAHHRAVAGRYVPSGRARLVTCHQPGEDPPWAQPGGWHCHLPPGAAPGQLTRAVAMALAPY
jgi:hypothetical protein